MGSGKDLPGLVSIFLVYILAQSWHEVSHKHQVYLEEGVLHQG